ncbi:MAG: TPM domain-containing protein [Acidobacteriota bacterium]|nr:TPM domain-containing protein [Acidobacteriota bacterium]
MLLAGFFLFEETSAFASGAPASPSRPDRYVTDLAGAIPKDRASALNEKLAAFERETSSQVMVYVDRKVPEGTTLEEFANRAFRAWGVGQKGKSNGVVFFLFTDGPRMRMEVGYGLEGAIPDARAHRINVEVIAPLLKAGDVAGALDAGADAILAAARGEPYKGTGKTEAERRRKASPFLIFLPIGFFIVIIVAFLFAFRAAWRNARRRGRRGSSSSDSSWTSSSSSSSGSSSSDSSSSGSSSDSSGGGGDSGGGGSSD